MVRVCAGDRAAFSTLVRRHQQPLMNFFSRCGVYTDAEDLVQQTFVRLYRYRDRYTARAKLTTFLYLLARQVWIDELRRRQRRDRLIQKLAAQLEPATGKDPGPGDEHLYIAAALAKLPVGLREVVVLGVYQELPYQEVASILKIPVGTVKSRMFNALRMLRRMLEENGWQRTT